MTVRIEKPAINVREELADLRKPTGIAGEAMLRAETPQEQFNLIGAGRRNWVINGDFSVSQRGNFTTSSSASDTAYTVDRFKNFVKNINANVLHTKAATVDGEIKNTLKMTATNTNSAGRLGFRHYVESGSNGRTPLAGKTATLSVWMKSNNPHAGFYLYDYGDPGYVYRVKHSGGGQWEKLILTVPLGTGVTSPNYYGYELNFAMQGNTNGGVSIASGDYVEIAEPQFELGKVATPFEHRSYGEELALCQRYYYLHAEGGNDFVGMGDFYEADQVDVGIQFPVTMRVTPTLDQVNGTNYYIVYTAGVAIYVSTAWIIFRPSPTAATLYATPAVNGTAGNAARIVTNSSGSYIAFKAEL